MVALATEGYIRDSVVGGGATTLAPCLAICHPNPWAKHLALYQLLLAQGGKGWLEDVIQTTSSQSYNTGSCTS